MDGTAILIKETLTQDSIGQYIPGEPEQTEIFVEEKSVTRQEWHMAGRSGLTPDFVLVTPAVNYSGQSVILYKEQKYGIYRTYASGDDIELYLERKGGINGGIRQVDSSGS